MVRLGRRQPGSLLMEDLVHDLGAPSKDRHDLMPVDQFGCGRLVVAGEQRDCFDRHAMRGQQRDERMPQLPWHSGVAKPGGLGDLAELPADVVVVKGRADGGGEDQVVVLPELPGGQPVR